MPPKHSQNLSGLSTQSNPSSGRSNRSHTADSDTALGSCACRALLRSDLSSGIRELRSSGLIPSELEAALVAALADDQAVEALLLFEETSFGNGFRREGAGRLCGLLRRLYRLSLYVERLAEAPPLAWADNPPPMDVDPLAVVVSQSTAVRALVRHYGWIHIGADTLVRPRYQPCSSAASSEPASDRGVVVELVDLPGSIAEQGSAAAAAVA